jgi:hypothetical protein
MHSGEDIDRETPSEATGRSRQVGNSRTRGTVGRNILEDDEMTSECNAKCRQDPFVNMW